MINDSGKVEDADLDPARRVMQRMVNTPPKPQQGSAKGKAKALAKDEDKRQKRTAGKGKA